MRLRRAWSAEVLLFSLMLLAGCRAPTEILLEIRTDADCRDVSGTTITVGRLEELESRPPTTSTSRCIPKTGYVGTLTLVPSGDEHDEVAVRVVTGFSKTPEQCVRDGYKGGCIVARRAVRYIPHETLEVPVLMEASCMDVPCGLTETCRAGRCIPAAAEAPEQCQESTGCGGTGGVAGQGGSAAPHPEGGAGGGAGGAGGDIAKDPPCVPACTNDHGTTSCSDAGMCEPQCSDGFADCDGVTHNGCEASLDSVTSCGSCDVACPANGATPTCVARTCGIRCDLNGTFGIKITLPTTWQRSTYVASGSGNFEFWLKLEGAHGEDRIDGELLECGRVMPEFQSSPIDETHVLEFPDSIFDHVPQYLEAVPVTVALGGSTPGATLATPPSAFLMGAVLPDAGSAAWPSKAASVTPVDHDRDGLPGITAVYSNGAGYDLPRTSATLNADRAHQPYIASRLVFSLDGKLTTCTESVGSAGVSFVDTRIFGCSAEAPGAECSAAEAEFLDANCIDYVLGSATYVMQKVPDGSTCADIRGAL